MQGLDQGLDRPLVSDLTEVSGSDEPDEPIGIVEGIHERCYRGCAHLPEDTGGGGLDIRIFIFERTDETICGRAPHHDEAGGGAELCVPGLLLERHDECIDLLLAGLLKHLFVLPQGYSLLRSPSFFQNLAAECLPPDIYHLSFPESGCCFHPYILILIFQGIAERVTSRPIRNLPERIDRSEAHLFSSPPQYQEEGVNYKRPEPPQRTGDSPPDLRCRISQMLDEDRDRFTDADKPYRPRRHSPDDRHRIVQCLLKRPEGATPEGHGGIDCSDPDPVVSVCKEVYERPDRATVTDTPECTGGSDAHILPGIVKDPDQRFNGIFIPDLAESVRSGDANLMMWVIERRDEVPDRLLPHAL